MSFVHATQRAKLLGNGEQKNQEKQTGHVIIWLRIAGRDTLLFPMVLDSMLIETQFKNALRFTLSDVCPFLSC